MATVRVCSKLKTSCKSVVFTNKVGMNSRYFVGVFNKAIIPLKLVGYEMIIANSYPTRARGVIVINYIGFNTRAALRQFHLNGIVHLSLSHRGFGSVGLFTSRIG